MDFVIFTAGGKAGTIETDGGIFDPSEGWDETIIPKGTYGISWDDPLYWAWSKDGVQVDEALTGLPNMESTTIKDFWKQQAGPPVESYTFKDGPLGEGDKSPFFEFPLAGKYSPSAPPASVADTLVVQVVSLRNVRFLGAEDPLPPDLPPLPPPDWIDTITSFDPCEKVPEFCAPTPVPGNKGIICLNQGWLEFCPKMDQTSTGLVRVRDFIAAAARHLLVARSFGGSDSEPRDSDLQAALRATGDRLEHAQRDGTDLARARSELLDVLRRNARTPHSARFADQMSHHVDFGLRAVDQCARGLAEPREADLDALLRYARNAHHNLAAALTNLQRLESWALPLELKALQREPQS